MSTGRIGLLRRDFTRRQPNENSRPDWQSIESRQVHRLPHLCGAGACASAAALTRRSITTGNQENRRSVSSAIRVSKPASRRCARRPESDEFVISAFCCTTPIASKRQPAFRKIASSVRRNLASFSILMIQRWLSRHADRACRSRGSRARRIRRSTRWRWVGRWPSRCTHLFGRDTRRTSGERAKW